MALTKCPECGRENVSDTAEMCPGCGYGIKAHFERIKAAELKQKIYETKIKMVEIPQEPKKMNTAYGLGIFFMFGAACGFLVSLIFGVVMLLAACWMMYEGSAQYEREMSKYNYAKENFESYQKEVVQEQERKAFMEASKIKCPQCGSTNVERISTVSRAVSVSVVGLASNKIGKQYKCGACKHMW